MTTFYLIRHAEKDADDQLLVGRTAGIPLSARGRHQAERLAGKLARRGIQHVYSSPIERARETADMIGRRLGLPVQASAALTEIEFGQWTGHSFQQLAPDERWRSFNLFRSGVRPPGGEAMLEVQARFVGEMLRLRTEHPQAAIALVSHADPIRAAVAYFLGAPGDLFGRIEIGLASTSMLTLDDYGACVVRLNETVEDSDHG